MTETARTGGKGSELEEALRSYFYQAGYFVVQGLPYQLSGEDVTDVDLWLYERPIAATRRRLIVDIKSKRIPKAAERIIWARGLQVALSVDGAIVATTDKQAHIRQLAKRLRVMLLDGDAVAKISHSEQLKDTDRLRLAELNALIKNVDVGRRSNDWKTTILDSRASLITSLGVHSMNTNLNAFAFFAEQAITSQSNSEQAGAALRMLFLTCAFTAVSIDFMLAEEAFRSQDERRQSIAHGIRLGRSEGDSVISSIRLAIGMARQYAHNGPAVAKQIEQSFQREIQNIPAEIIAEYVSRISTTDTLFNVARELEAAAFAREPPSFDQLSGDGKSLLGVLLDFSQVAREKIALAWVQEKSA